MQKLSWMDQRKGELIAETVDEEMVEKGSFQSNGVQIPSGKQGKPDMVDASDTEDVDEEKEGHQTPLSNLFASFQDLEDEEDLYQAILSASKECISDSDQPLKFFKTKGKRSKLKRVPRKNPDLKVCL